MNAQTAARPRAETRRVAGKANRINAEKALRARIRHQIAAEERASRRADRKAQSMREEGHYSDAARKQANADHHRSRAAVLLLVLEDSREIR